MRNKKQDQQSGSGLRLSYPVPDAVSQQAAALWWHSFGPWRGSTRSPEMSPSHAIVALDDEDAVWGVIGLRDAKGGFLLRIPLLARLVYRGGPPTADLLIDGIVVRKTRMGTGRSLVAAAAKLARDRGHPVLRAEVKSRNRTALAFYDSLGFKLVGCGRYGWPWSGQVLILRSDVQTPERSADRPEPATGLAEDAGDPAHNHERAR